MQAWTPFHLQVLVWRLPPYIVGGMGTSFAGACREPFLSTSMDRHIVGVIETPSVHAGLNTGSAGIE